MKRLLLIASIFGTIDCSQLSQKIDNSLNEKMFKAADNKDLETLKKLFAGNTIPDINAKSKNNWPAIVTASGYQSRNIDVVRFLLEHGANVNEPNLNFSGSGPAQTALSLAAYDKDVELVKLLLKHGANPNFLVQGVNPILLEILPRVYDASGYAVIKMLLQAGANPDMKGRGNKTASEVAKNSSDKNIKEIFRNEEARTKTVNQMQLPKKAIDIALSRSGVPAQEVSSYL